ncbi:peptidoglycan DD-metalloendopeptidase family protein [Janibacter cremeus]|uniref:peptidoglycan DD-metalloendopeptidase family protein n=1 Tax=Janibacter cremeus TaxID=1285192 RepID=UPI0023F6ACD0|nr:peptidoglycan DD-metalloendopeptidase family protein [Janibacter cremeus]WEV79605.1 peptidoglycan DD-metalloendopeptidase family protein [Janibacter cremeus]
MSVTLSACLFTGAVTHASAEPEPKQQKERVEERLSEAEGDLHETSGDLVEAHKALERTRGKLPAAKSKAEEAAAAEAEARSAYDDAVAAHEVAQANERKAENELRTTSTKISRARSAVGSFAGKVYQRDGIGTMSVAVGSEDPSDFIDKMIMAESVGETQGAALQDLSTSRANLVSTGDRLQALREQTKQAKETKESALASATEASSAADAAQADLESLEKDQSSQAAALEREKAKDAERVESLQAESDKLTKILEERARQARIREAEIRKARAAQERREAKARERARREQERREQQARERERERASRKSSSSPAPAPAPPPPPPKPPKPPADTGVLRAPSGGYVSSEFGLRFHPIHQTSRLHSGRDYAANCGTPVYAATSGTVISAGVAGGYGNQLVIDHGVKRGVSLATTYNHLQRFTVTGGHVERGQVIAYVGTTGTSTGCHLHFETRENGTPTDPRRWL